MVIVSELVAERLISSIYNMLFQLFIPLVKGGIKGVGGAFGKGKKKTFHYSE